MTTSSLESTLGLAPTPPDGPPEPPGGYASVLKNKNFLILWAGQVFSQLADRIVLVVFIAVITAHFGANDTYNSYLYIAFTIPAILLTAVAGVFVDRWPRRAVLVLTSLMRALFVAFLPIAAKGGLLSIYTLAFLLSAATQFFVPAEAATIPMIVRKADLLAANAMFTTTMMASVIFGFALGDPLIELFSLKQVHWSIVGFFCLSTAILMLLKTPPATMVAKSTEELAPQKVKKTLKEAYQEFAADLMEGFQFIQEHRLVRTAIFLLAFLFSGVVALCFMFITFARAFLYEDPALASQKFGYIIAYSGVGMAIGAMLVGWINDGVKRRGWLVYGGFVFAGICLASLALVTVVAPDIQSVFLEIPTWTLPVLNIEISPLPVTDRMAYTYALSTLMGVGASFIAIPVQALIHELLPEDKRGKVLGVQFTILSTCSTLPVVITAFITEMFKLQPIMAVMGGSFVLVGLIGLIRRLRSPYDDSSTW